MGGAGSDWAQIATAIFAGLLVLITGLAYHQGLVGGGRYRPITVSPTSAAVSGGGHYSLGENIPASTVRLVRVNLLNRSDREQFLEFDPERTRLWRAGTTTVARLLARPIRMDPYSGGTWELAFECPADWLSEQPDATTGCFAGHYKMTLRLATRVGKSATWRWPRQVQLRPF